MFSNFFELTILSAIQGISEFLPVSSSAHLILANDISNLGIGSIYLDTGIADKIVNSKKFENLSLIHI